MKQLPVAMITVILAAGAGPQAASACSPAAHPPSVRPETGPECDWSFRTGDYEAVSLSGLTDLGGGVIAQRLREGNACSFEASLLVTDCKSGEAMLFGPDRVTLMEGNTSLPVLRLLDRLEKRPRGSFASLSAVLAQAEASGVRTSVSVPKGSELRFGGKVRMPLHCGCATLYPGATK